MNKTFVALNVITVLLLCFIFGNILLKTNLEIKSTDIQELSLDQILSQFQESPLDKELPPNQTNSSIIYSNEKVRNAITFCRYYLNEPKLLNEEHPDIYNQCYVFHFIANSNIPAYKWMEYYNDWIISYAFEISIEDMNEKCDYIPRSYKDSNFENYTYDDIKNGVSYFKPYINKPELFEEARRHIYPEWVDYRDRVCPGVSYDTLIKYYNYWIISYAFGI